MITKEMLKMMTVEFPKIKARSNGTVWITRCPFHKDYKERAQFFIDTVSKKYHCIECTVRGELKSLIQDIADAKDD